jgi:hypothetical protein
MCSKPRPASTATLIALLCTLPAQAQQEPAPSAEPEEAEDTPAFLQGLMLGGYVETFYQWNFNDPSNGLTNYRGFDNRHNTFTLSNVVLDTQWERERVSGRLALQVGLTPSTYYLAEPVRPGSPGANATGPELWKYLQQAWAGYRLPVGAGLLVQGGLFLSPIGPETMAVHGNWSWSRSNLFFGLPFYHTGLRATYPLGDWAVTAAVYNGWNSVVDNNAEKSLSLQATYTLPDKLALSMLYFSGVEREPGAPEGRPWRHLLDIHATWTVSPTLSLLAHANGGLEPNAFGTSTWGAGALAGRVRLLTTLFLAVRGDLFYESAASSAEGSASRLFWPVEWVSSGTATLDWRPHDNASIRLEYRHDEAAGELYFRLAANSRSQDTLTLGATAWF